MNKKLAGLILAAAMITSSVTACSSASAKDTEAANTTAAEQTATQSASAAAESTAAATATATAETTAATMETTSAAEAVDKNLPAGITDSLSAMILTYGQDDYGADTVITNDQAVTYLENITRLFYSSRAEAVEAIGTDYKYAAFDETEIDQLLNQAFGSRYSTRELLTEDTLLVYNAHTYYVPLRDDAAAAPELIYTSGDQTTNEYQLTITELGKQTPLTLTLVPSADNTNGYSIVSYTRG